MINDIDIVATNREGLYILSLGLDKFITIHIGSDYRITPISKVKPLGALTKMGYWYAPTYEDKEKLTLSAMNELIVSRLNKNES